MIIDNVKYIDNKNLVRLKEFINSEELQKNITMNNDLLCYIEELTSFDLTCISCKIKIFSQAKNICERLKHFYKVFNLVRKNNNKKISLEITEEKEMDIFKMNKVITHFLEATIYIDLL